MKCSNSKRVFFGRNISIEEKDENCKVFVMKDQTGKGVMKSYIVFPGIELMFNNFQMCHGHSEFRPNVPMLTINHCREGRLEWEVQNGTYMYINEGDIQISTNEYGNNFFSFPLAYYQGVTVAIYIEQALDTMDEIFEEFSINLQQIKAKFCSRSSSFLMRTTKAMHHIFSELYDVPDEICINYYRIKVLELLLLLSVVNTKTHIDNHQYFPKRQVETVKEMMAFLRKHMDEHITLQELSVKFNISSTAMKNCFKAIYGQSIYAYMRTYRIQKAAQFLRKTDDTVTTIASKVGYSNPSKFAAAFKEIKGMPPTEYQKAFVGME